MEDEQILKWETEYKKGFAKPLILIMLGEGENYAYALTKRINTVTRGQISISTSNIYPILKNLSDDSLITESRSKENKRVMYSLTKEGKAFLVQLNESMQDFIELMLKITKEHIKEV